MATESDPIHAAFHEPDTPIYRVVNGFIWVLIVASVGLFLVELAFGLQISRHPVYRAVDQVILIVFAVEIALRVLTYRDPALRFFDLSPAQRLRVQVRSRLRFLLEPLNLVDLITVLALVPELRGLRAIRLLRLLRSRKLFKYSNPFSSIARAFHDNRLLYYFAFTVLGAEVLLGGVSITLIERAGNPDITSLADGFWWALVTITTVGFGDISPVTPVGRIVGSTLMVGGMFTLALFAGVVGQTLLASFLNLREEQYRMSKPLDHVIVCGYNVGARMLLDALIDELGGQTSVLIMAPGDRDPDVPPDFAWVDGDPTKEQELDKVSPERARAVVVVAERALPPQQADAVSIMTVFTFRAYLQRHPDVGKRARPLHVVCEVLEHENVSHARTAGANEIIETNRVGFGMLAHTVSMPGTGSILGRVANVGAHSLYVGPPPADWELPVSFADIAHHLKESHDVLAIGVRSLDGGDTVNPPGELEVGPGTQIIYLAERPVLAG